MSHTIHKIEDAMTSAEVRLACQKPISQEEFSEEIAAPSALSEPSLAAGQPGYLEPSDLMAHKPSYFLLRAYNSYGYNSQLFHEQFTIPQ